MSLILEALKKAERQHKLGEVPGIRADVSPAPTSGLRGLGWLMLLLFAGIMLGLGIYLGGGQPSLSDKAGEVPADIPISRQEVPPAPAPAIEPETPPAVASPAEEPVPPPVAEVKAPAKLPKPQPARPLSEMPSGFVVNLPSLNIDIHSYDKQASKRYVLINMEKYHEGDYLSEGPLLVEIRPDGVVLEHFGERFILPIGNQ
jgi:general secretion pathway protein B